MTVTMILLQIKRKGSRLQPEQAKPATRGGRLHNEPFLG